MKTVGPRISSLLVFLAGLGTGIGVVLSVQSLREVFTPSPTHYQATLYLPTRDNAGQPFSDDRWREAIQLLVTRHGGATVGGEFEGWWVEDATGKTHREPVRVVVVTLPRDQVKVLVQTAREVGAKLDQEAVYYRLEEAHIRVIPIGKNPGNRNETPAGN